MELRYRLALVTGAGGGLGREIAVALGRLGCALLVVDRDPRAAAETVAEVERSRVRAWACQADLSLDADVRMVADRARDLGGADLLVNNAGGWTSGAQWPEAADEEWSRTLDLNLRTPMLLTQLFVATAEAVDAVSRRSGTPGVVNVGSSAGIETDGYASPEYAAAKAGLVRFTRSLSEPVGARGVRVMAVVPGWIGLPRAHEEWAALSAEEQASRPALVPTATVCRAVVDLLARGHPGQVVELR